jgi:hypothetical protein
MSFDLGQTFYLDKRSVENSQAAIVTSVELYFSAKPISNKTDSGISEPGVVVSLCATKEDGSPRLDDFVTQQYTARVEYSNINVDTTGATSTKFTFTEPIAIATDRSYAFLIKFDGSDKGFRLFGNKAGTIALNTSSVTQVSSGTVDGNAYRITNGFTLTPLTDTDLTFKINIAKFTTLSETYQFRNRAYEIMKVASVNGSFKGGEEVIQERSSLTGTINVSSATKEVTGTGTSFTSTVTVNDKIIITDGTAGNTNIRVVNTVTNATHLVLDEYPSFSNTSASYYKTVIGNLFVYNSISDEMILQDSTANSTLYLTTSTTLRGIDSGATATISEIKNANVNAVVPSFAVREPSGTSSSITLNFANTGGSVSSTRKQNGILSKRSFIDQYDAIVASRTTEVTAATPFRSFIGEITFTTTNPYVSPMVQEHNLDAFVERYEINNTTTNEYLGQGAALARYISKQVNLTNDQLAEDFKIYLSAFKPINTDIKVYLRALNPEDSEAFDLKDWTEMELIQSQNLLSNPANKNDFIELAYNIPFFQSGTQIPGEFKTESANAVIVGTSGSVNTDITVGDLVHVYSPLIEDTHFVDTVTAANTTSFTVGTSVSNSSLVGTGFYVNKITRKNSGYLDIQNGNIFTYYNRSSARFNGYQTFAVKIVLLSSDGINIPYVRDLRALAVSA